MTKRLITCMVLAGLVGLASTVQAQVRYTPEGQYVGQARRPVAESDSLLADYNSVVTLYEQQRYAEAIDLAEDLIDEDVNQKSPLLEPLYYYMGRAYMDNGELTDAVDTFEELLQRFPYTNFMGEVYQAEFDIAKRYLDGSYKFRILGIPFSMASTGRALIERLLERAPHSSFAPEGQFLVAMYYFDSRQFSEAEMSFQQVTRLYPDTEYARRARYWRAVALMNNSAGPRYGVSNVRDAEILFAEYLEDYPESENSKEVRRQLVLARSIQAQWALHYAEFYRDRGEPAAAAMYYRQVLAAPKFTGLPAIDEARRALASLEEGEEDDR